MILEGWEVCNWSWTSEVLDGSGRMDGSGRNGRGKKNGGWLMMINIVKNGDGCEERVLDVLEGRHGQCYRTMP